MRIDTIEIIEIIQTKREYLYNIKCIIIIQYMYVYILNKTQTEKKQNKNKKDPYKFEHFLSIKSEKKENHIKRRKTEKNEPKVD